MTRMIFDGSTVAFLPLSDADPGSPVGSHRDCWYTGKTIGAGYLERATQTMTLTAAGILRGQQVGRATSSDKDRGTI